MKPTHAITQETCNLHSFSGNFDVYSINVILFVSMALTGMVIRVHNHVTVFYNSSNWWKVSLSLSKHSFASFDIIIL